MSSNEKRLRGRCLAHGTVKDLFAVYRDPHNPNTEYCACCGKDTLFCAECKWELINL